MFKIKEVSKIAGISTRTLRYYDQIGLLKPAYVNESNYRMYSEKEIDLLQQILFYKELGFSLDRIKAIVFDDEFVILDSLENQKKELLKKRKNIDVLLKTIENSIEYQKGVIELSNDKKFEGLKEQMVSENEKNYGEEARSLYGNETVDASYMRIKKMSKYEFKRAEELGKEILSLLGKIYQSDDVNSVEAKKLALMHQEWIQLYWSTYTKEAHNGLCEMYLCDERFTAYYDKVGKGATQFLVSAVKANL